MKAVLFLLLFYFANAFATAPLFMLKMESDVDSALTNLWENTIRQLLEEVNINSKPVSIGDFPECKDLDCLVSQTRIAGAQGLFRGRLKAVGSDSVNIRLHIYWLAGNTVPETEVKGTFPLSWDSAIRSGAILKLLSGITGKTVNQNNENKDESVIIVETYPDNAVILLNGVSTCTSPCNLYASKKTNNIISAYWHSDENLWAAKSDVKPNVDTVKIYLELKRSKASTEIHSNPENALIFENGTLDIKTKAIGKTPYLLKGAPGETQLRLFLSGYKDTLVNISVDAVDRKIAHIQMRPITDPQELAAQNIFEQAKTKNIVGLGLLGGSLGPFISGAILCVIAQDDYKKAKKLKDELMKPSIGGKNFELKVKENKKAVDKGNEKMTIGLSLIGVGTLFAGVGFALSF